MIQTREDLAFYLREDARVKIKRERCGCIRMAANLWYGNDSYRVFRYLKALRKYEFAINGGRGWFGTIRKALAKARWHRLGARYHININPNVVGYGFRVPHLVGGVIINCFSVGHYCTANSGVIVGNNNKGGMARIGNNVDLSVGCKVIGGVQIGDDVIVAPNSVVVKDVPDHCIVSGVPAIIIKQGGKKVI